MAWHRFRGAGDDPLNHRSATFSLLLAAVALAPLAVAEETCVGDATTGACAYSQSDERFSATGAYAYDWNTFTLVAAGTNEGHGFFGYTRGADAFAYSGLAGQYVALVAAQNDQFPSDGEYEQGAVVLATWSDSGNPAAAVEAFYWDSDGDGDADQAAVASGASVALLP